MEEGLDRDGELPSMHPFGRSLPADVEARIASFLPPNEVALNLRLTCKAAAAADHLTRKVRLSMPVPAPAFAARWGHKAAVQNLVLAQRRQLMCLTAASGVVENLALVASLVGCTLSADVLSAAAAAGQVEALRWLRLQGCPLAEKALESAAAAGQLEACRYLRAAGCPWSHTTLAAAAAAGHTAVCTWALSAGCPASDLAPAEAARHGHEQLMLHILQLRHALAGASPGAFPDPPDPRVLLPAVAEGLPLSSLQRLYDELLYVPPGEDIRTHVLDGSIDRYPMDERSKKWVVAAAAASPTPDWRDKVAWLLAQPRSYPPAPGAVDKVMQAPGARQRLEWLLGLGWDLDLEHAAYVAASEGDVESLEYLLRLMEGRKGEEQGRGDGGEEAGGGERWQQQQQQGKGREGGRAGGSGGGSGSVGEGEGGGGGGLVGGTGMGAVGEGRGGSSGAGGGVDGVSWRVAYFAAAGGQEAGGHLAVLRLLKARGCRVGRLPGDVRAAAVRGGQLHVVQWLAEQAEAEDNAELEQDAAKAGAGVAAGEGGVAGRWAAVEWSEELFGLAVQSGCGELVEWLAARGCPFGAGAFVAAAWAGNGPLLRWLAERGCPMSPDAYLRALRGGDLATLDLLAALGCPWRPNEQRHAPNDQRPTANVFGLARKWRCGVPVMRWLAAAGCPMDFRRLAKEARLRGDTDMAAWAEGELQRQQQQKEQKEQELVKVAEESGREGQAGAGAGAVAGAGLGLQVVGRAV